MIFGISLVVFLPDIWISSLRFCIHLFMRMISGFGLLLLMASLLHVRPMICYIRPSSGCPGPPGFGGRLFPNYGVLWCGGLFAENFWLSMSFSLSIILTLLSVLFIVQLRRHRTMCWRSAGSLVFYMILFLVFLLSSYVMIGVLLVYYCRHNKWFRQNKSVTYGGWLSSLPSTLFGLPIFGHSTRMWLHRIIGVWLILSLVREANISSCGHCMVLMILWSIVVFGSRRCIGLRLPAITIHWRPSSPGFL